MKSLTLLKRTILKTIKWSIRFTTDQRMCSADIIQEVLKEIKNVDGNLIVYLTKQILRENHIFRKIKFNNRYMWRIEESKLKLRSDIHKQNVTMPRTKSKANCTKNLSYRQNYIETPMLINDYKYAKSVAWYNTLYSETTKKLLISRHSSMYEFNRCLGDYLRYICQGDNEIYELKKISSNKEIDGEVISRIFGENMLPEGFKWDNIDYDSVMNASIMKHIMLRDCILRTDKCIARSK